MGLAVVQSVVGSWASGSSWSASITATSGNLIVGSIHFWAGNSSNNVTTYGDGGTNTYDQIDTGSEVSAGILSRLITFYANNITGGALTFTVNASTATIDRARVVLTELSGGDITAPLDVHAMQLQTAPGTGTDAVTSGDVTTTADGEYCYGATLVSNSFLLPVAGTGYDSISVANYMCAEGKVQTSAGLTAATFTVSFDGRIRSAVATFKAAAGGAAVTPILMRHYRARKV